jgi:hypothetical protein
VAAWILILSPASKLIPAGEAFTCVLAAMLSLKNSYSVFELDVSTKLAFTSIAEEASLFTQ